MLQCVFDGIKAGVRRIFFGLTILLVFALTLTSVRAQTVTGAMGFDVWTVPTDQVRYLPNYSTPKDFSPGNAWVRGIARHQLATDFGLLTFTAQGRASQIDGTRIDRLDADWRVTNSAGVRVGVLPYRISWCRVHDNRSPWLSEPDAFCRFSGLNEISQGAFGGQVYRATAVGGWLVDAMAGVYRPMVDGQNDKLGPYRTVGLTVKHHGQGVSFNALHLGTGIQARAAWLGTVQHQNSDSGGFQRRLDYDTFYLAAEGNLTDKIDLRASLSQYSGMQKNPASPYSWVGLSSTVEASYKITPKHRLSFGASDYTNTTTYAQPPNGQILRVNTLSVAYRLDLDDGWYVLAQATSSTDDSTTRRGLQSVKAGDAFGLRVAKVFR
jgi:hypothetical protein